MNDETVRSIHISLRVVTSQRSYVLDRDVGSTQEAAEVVAEWARELDEQ